MAPDNKQSLIPNACRFTAFNGTKSKKYAEPNGTLIINDNIDNSIIDGNDVNVDATVDCCADDDLLSLFMPPPSPSIDD